MEEVGFFRTLVVITNILLVLSHFKVVQTQTTIQPPLTRCPEGYILNTNGLCYPNRIKVTQMIPTTTNNSCPQGYILHPDNLCYPIETKRCPTETSSTTTNTRCPEGYTLNTNGLCYPNGIKATQTIPTETATNNRCPQGYILHPDNLCYPIEIKPCPADITTTTTTKTTTTTTTTTPTPAEIVKIRCPTGSIMFKNKCRKITCSLGEYYQGKCIYPVCPSGLVWRGKKCQEPGYITTVIEIDNEIINEQNEKPITLTMSQTNKKVHHTTTTTEKPLTTPRSTIISTTKSTLLKTTNTMSSTNNDAKVTCCKVFTPRICKLYGSKWVCYNRKYDSCDKRICTAPVVYLKAPEIIHKPPVLIMPPNPQFNTWDNRNVGNNLNVDCSGCAALHSESCSPYCYRHICPNASCKYMDLNEYCNYYPGQNGCLPRDGCLWNWC